jgi:phage tail sheath protein FI
MEETPVTAGVYVAEHSGGPEPIEGVPTSTAGMVGATERGPLQPHLITSWSEYQTWFGAATADSFLAFAVQGFFDNGGQRVFVARVAGAGSATATMTLPTAAAPLRLRAIGPGEWGNCLTARVASARLTILLNGDVVEDFDNLTAEPGSPNDIATVINDKSHFVTVEEGVTNRPLDGEVSATGGTSVDPQPADFVTALAALETIDEVSLLTVPDEVRDRNGTITAAVVAQCERLRDRFAIVSAYGNQDDIETLRPPRDTSYGAFYYPWLRVRDAARNEAVLMPPGGHVCGIYARTDLVRGVHKAPANEVVRGLFAGGAGEPPPLEFTITDREQDIVNPRGVNVIRDFSKQGRGVLLCGARTMSSDPEWKYVNVRRLLAYIEQSIAKGTRWVVFEPNNEATWSLFDRKATIFLLRLWRDGMLVGSREDQAFFVRCDRTTMTQDDIDNGRLVCLVGVAPIKPSEFIVFRICQKTR